MLEFTWVRNIEFFPPYRESWSELRSICIGTKSRNLGDALALTTLPRKLRRKNPNLRISTYLRGFNPVVFWRNPDISSVSCLPRTLYGDDANLDFGQLIEQKEFFFGLEPSQPVKPEIHLTANETHWAREFLSRKTSEPRKPLCLLHPWGNTHKKVLPVEAWDEMVAKWRRFYRFWQVGIEGHSAIAGCDYYFLLRPARWQARRLFAISSLASAFIGVDSGPMHVARAFEIPSLILLPSASRAPEEIFQSRRASPYFLHENWRYSVLYQENAHILAHGADLSKPIDEFLGKWRHPLDGL